MSNLSFRCPRLSDREVVEHFRRIVEKMSFTNPQITFMPWQGGNWHSAPIITVETHDVFREILMSNSSCATTMALVLPIHAQGQQPWQIIKIQREPRDLFDKVEIDWQGNRGLSEPEFAKLLGIARQEFGEIKIDQALTGFSNETIDKYMEARDATLTRLQSVTEELLFGIHKRQHELDEQFQQRIDVLNTQTEERRKALQNQHEERQAALGNQESDLKKRLAEFETNESKYLRRQLRRDMLQVLEGFKSKFEVTAGTRNLRWPVMIFSLTMLVGFGTLMSVSFYQSFKIFGSPDISKINTVGMIVLATKQLGLTAAFVGVAWFFLRWNDRWFRQHADAEFMFKRLGLDINRASWVVEMAMEWKAEKGTDIPTELLDRLTRNLFKEVSGRGDEGEAPPTVADIILGSAATVKIKTAGGTEIDLDRKGLQKALSQGTD
jgi:hypothetical protein